ncbi:MAG: glutamine--fructose-6-phosphate transaminase (isomerizing) [Alphaproteobacteria bacterium]|nr:glutamine--fructose-6-phosphate transaminase (isomerizing) [Alphaproteobacteria bacterium]
MCGIIGVISKDNNNVVPDILNGLEKLEYRGYDSAGLAVVADSGLKRIRAVGRLENLINKLKVNPISGAIGIGHTRWATHGKATEENAHPMLTKDVAIVHNGIIENYKELKSDLLKKGYEFTSQTDTEVVAVYLQMELDNGLSPREAFRKMLQVVRGTYAFLAIFQAQPDVVFCARNKSPMAVGFGKNMCVGSDASSISESCSEIVYLDDGDYAEVMKDGVTFFDGEFNVVNKSRVAITDDLVNSGKGGYSHYMIKEIMEQPSAIRKTLLGNEVPKNFFDKVSRILILACGTSYHAGLVGKYWFEKHLRLPTCVEIASEYRYRSPVIEDDTLVLVITQSGETIDTLEAMEYVKKNNNTCRLAAITNVLKSAISRSADFVFHTEAGVEIGVASTKAFTAQLTVLAKLAFCKNPELLNQLQNLPQACEDSLLLKEDIDRIAYRMKDCANAIYLGRDNLYPIALEGALKLKEISYIHAEGFAAGEMKHGPVALIDDIVPVVCLCPSGNMFDKMFSNIQVAQARGKNIVVFTDFVGAKSFDKSVRKIVLPSINQELYPILYSIPLQLLAYTTTVLKGEDVDKPRNLAKSVTVE